MPAVSRAQRELAIEDLRRLAAGEKPRTTMSREDLEEVAHTPPTYLPERVKTPRHSLPRVDAGHTRVKTPKKAGKR